MRKICFITGSRAEFGILSPLMHKIKDSDEAQLQIIATNMHLSPSFGMTVREIEDEGFQIDYKIESLLSAETPSSTVKSMGLTQIGLADAFVKLKPDLAVILGDRYEMLAAASAALIFRIPIAHLHGGEITEGAYDDYIRHAITKLSTLHFASTDEYARRIINMGEELERVFSLGAPGVDNIRHSAIPSLKELEDSIGFDTGGNFIVVVFHPVTTLPGMETRLTEDFIKGVSPALSMGYKILITLPNSDTGALSVRKILSEWAQNNPETIKAVDSLGRLRFYSALKHASAIVGNSSSGIIEAPSFGIPTVNVGIRQKGRSQGPSVINCGDSSEEITEALLKALSSEFRDSLNKIDRKEWNPYEKENTVENIADKLIYAPLPKFKKFHDSDK